MSVLLYNLALALIGAGTLATQRHRLPMRGLVGFVMALFGLGLVLGFVFHKEFALAPMFAAMRMWSYGLFVQLTLLTWVWAWLDRQRRPRTSFVFAVLGVLVAAIGIDAFFVEPSALELNEVVIRSDKVQEELTIAVLADIQSEEVGPYERAAVEAAMAASPDLVLLPGDYLQPRSDAERADNEARLRKIFADAKITPARGAFAVPGNVDPEGWHKLFEGTGVTTATASRTYPAGPGVQVTALTLEDSFATDLKLGPQPGFHIVLGHGPDFALGAVQADLLVAGHTHGGQVRLPFIGPLVTLAQIPREWAAGVTQRPGGGTLVVSRGIGMERGLAPRLRFRCPPEVVIVRVRPE